MKSFGQHLVNSVLPTDKRDRGPLTKGNLTGLLAEMAREKPEDYGQQVSRLKRLGDEVSTLEGISVGLDDIEPRIAARDAVLAPHLAAFDAAGTDDEREKALLAGQRAILEHTKAHPGAMSEMARSGGRGNFAQLMKIVASPVAARDETDRVTPWPIRRSYSEGLRPSEAWVAGNEARIDTIRSNIAVVEPGDLAKILINNMSDHVVTSPDCGTHNGVSLPGNSSDIMDRFLAEPAADFPAGTQVTPAVAARLRNVAHVVVRSPMTCNLHDGLCQRCAGLSPAGHPHSIGTNVGLRSAQAMAEPLTQMALSAKHGGQLAKGNNEPTIEGVKGVRQLIEIPNSFTHRATLAEHAGSITAVHVAPQGGHNVVVGDVEHYIPPELQVIVRPGERVAAGDALSNGVPKPDDVVRHKGLGAGRDYMVGALRRLYADKGIDLDRRHFETLAKSVLNHMYVADADTEAHPGFLRGDVVSYNTVRDALAKSAREVPVRDAVGETLSHEVRHWTAGTRVTPEMADAFARQGITTVRIADNAPVLEPVMRPATRTPLLNPDWMARLGHRYLRESLLAGAHRGDVSNIHGTHPVPAYAHGAEFGQGEGGKY